MEGATDSFLCGGDFQVIGYTSQLCKHRRNEFKLKIMQINEGKFIKYQTLKYYSIVF